MIIVISIGIAILSVLMALVSLWRQDKLDEVKRVRKKLKREKVIFHSGS